MEEREWGTCREQEEESVREELVGDECHIGGFGPCEGSVATRKWLLSLL